MIYKFLVVTTFKWWIIYTNNFDCKCIYMQKWYINKMVECLLGSISVDSHTFII